MSFPVLFARFDQFNIDKEQHRREENIPINGIDALQGRRHHLQHLLLGNEGINEHLFWPVAPVKGVGTEPGPCTVVHVSGRGGDDDLTQQRVGLSQWEEVSEGVVAGDIIGDKVSTEPR